MDKNITLTTFDINTIGDSTQMIKALIPYLEPESQRMVAILVRIRELMLTIRYFSNPNLKKQSFSSNDEMLKQLKKFCSPEMANMIDMMMKFLSMSEMMNVLSGIEGLNSENSGMSDILNLFGMMKDNKNSDNTNSDNTESDSKGPDFPMFNGHQKDLFDEYMKTLDNLF